MNHQTFNIPSATLNVAVTQSPFVLDISLLDRQNLPGLINERRGGSVSDKLLYPRYLQIVNSTGAPIGYKLISDDIDKNSFLGIVSSRPKGFISIDLGNSQFTGTTALTGSLSATAYNVEAQGDVFDTISFTPSGAEATINDVITTLSAATGSTLTITATLVTLKGKPQIRFEIDNQGSSFKLIPYLDAFLTDLKNNLPGNPDVTISDIYGHLLGTGVIQVANGTTQLEDKLFRVKYLLLQKISGTVSSPLTVTGINYA